MRELVVEIPGRPPTPNARRHWRTVAKDNAKWKQIAAEATIRAIAGREWPPIEYAEVDVAVIVPDERDRDWDNVVASLKPCFDGIRAGGAIVDDSIRRLPSRRVEVVMQRHLSKVLVRLREIPAPGSLGL